MIKNDLRTALRSVVRQRGYTLINVAGLAVGIVACLIIVLYLRYEFSYNTQHDDIDRLYRLIRHVRPADNSPEYDARGVQWRAGTDLVSEISEVEDATGFIVRPMWAGLDDRGFNIDGNMASDNFLQVLTYPLLTGGRPKLTPDAAYVTESFARKLYGSTDVVGRPVKLKNKWVNKEFQIAGILRDISSTTGLSVLLLVCVNYVNLATARGLRRGLDVGIRKVLGATRAQLARRFLWEAVVLCGIAGLGAIGLVSIFLPLASDMLELGSDPSMDGSVYAFAAGMTILVGVLSGVYPALFLSKFEPINALKGPASGSTLFRKTLVVLQFSVSVVLIVGTLVAYDQIAFLMSKDLGFEHEGRITMPIFLEDQSLRKQFLSVRTRFDQVPDVIESCLSNLLIGTEGNLSRLYIKKPGSTDSTNVFIKQVDERFTDVYHIEILEGRSLESMDMGKRNVIINRTAARATGLKAGDIAKGRGNDFHIVGIYEDFHNRSLHLPIRPLMLRSLPFFNYVTVRIQTDNLTRTLGDLKMAWREFLPNRPFQYEFVDDRLANFYRKDLRTLQAFAVFSAIAIFVACLGLLGLISFVTEMRTKEIAVRRVLGSTSLQLMSLLLGDFAKLVGMAAVLAWPVAYIITRSWLDSFTYRIDLGLIPFLAGGLLALVIALITISFQAMRTVHADPVRSLRHE